jgi:hypothetical protein
MYNGFKQQQFTAKQGERMKRNGYLLIAWLANVIYVGVTLYDVENIIRGIGERPALDTTILLQLFVPHLVIVGVGLMLNVIAWWLNKRILALIAAILYVASLAFMPFNFGQLLIQTVACFIAYATMKPNLPTTSTP